MAKSTKRSLEPKQIVRTKRRNPGVNAKTKTSGLKQSKNYVKKYRGQGR